MKLFDRILFMTLMSESIKESMVRSFATDRFNPFSITSCVPYGNSWYDSQGEELGETVRVNAPGKPSAVLYILFSSSVRRLEDYDLMKVSSINYFFSNTPNSVLTFIGCRSGVKALLFYHYSLQFKRGKGNETETD
jgi:hypothetical protein